MNSVTFVKGASGRITGFVSSGHAMSSADGTYDLVCSAVSALTITAANALETVAGIVPRTEMEDGYLSCFLPGTPDPKQQEKAEIIFETILTGLKNIEEAYPEYVRVEMRNGGRANA
ncbi:MAG: ribosomal-processing cysteine protease Prp [Clostridia bacterium]|nr:ribosomal-processing cysteine protease Prp [Clostridia bacterium]